MNTVWQADELACVVQLLWLTAASINPNEIGTNISVPVLQPFPFPFSSTTTSNDSDSNPSSSSSTGIPIIVRADCAYQQRHLRNAFRKRPRWCIIDDHDSDNNNGRGEDTLPSPTSQQHSNFSNETKVYNNPNLVSIQINEYENIEWDNVMNPPYIITNNFCVRKGLGRKAGLAKALGNHCTRCTCLPCPIVTAVPRTLIIDSTSIFINRPKWLDYRSAVAECLYEVDDMISEALDKYSSTSNNGGTKPLWILKPSITNKGADIHIVSSFEEVKHYITSLPELGQWVLQEYVSNPLLLHLPVLSSTQVDNGHKFHLRVYVVAVGALSVFVYPETLVLIAPQVYDQHNPSNIGAHITNTCVGVDDKSFTETLHVRCLSELPSILYQGATVQKLTNDHRNISSLKEATQIVDKIYKDICSIVAHTFAAMEGDVGGYMPIPRCYELYGVDFLVTSDADPNEETYYYTVKLLEYNPSPDIKQTGNRLDYIIENMMNGVISLTIDQRITINDKKELNRNVAIPLPTSNTVTVIPSNATEEDWTINVLPYGSSDATNNNTVILPNTNGIMHEPVRDQPSGWDCVYSKYWAPAHAQMNVKVQ